MEKLDFTKQYKSLYTPSAREAQIVEVPSFQFLMLDGTGDPNTAAEYKAAVGALYKVAYTLKFAHKKTAGEDYAVAPLEGLWGMAAGLPYDPDRRDLWIWTMMIALPDFISEAEVARAVEEAVRKTGDPTPTRIRLERFTEGRAAQIMHIGPYAAEAPTIQRLHEDVARQGLALRGRHHEIYLSDPNRSAPEKMRTILRHPVE